MLLRIRWFLMGALTIAGLAGYLLNELRKAREKLTPRAVANTGLRRVAKLLDTAADAVQPDPEMR